MSSSEFANDNDDAAVSDQSDANSAGKIPWREARRIMKRRPTKLPEQPLKEICSALSLGRTAGKKEAHQAAANCFDSRFAEELELFTRAAALWSRVVSGLERQERALRTAFRHTSEFQKVPDKLLPWTTFDRAQVVTLAAAAPKSKQGIDSAANSASHLGGGEEV